MSAGFEVRNHSTKLGSMHPEAMFTIQVLADSNWAEVDLAAALVALTAAHAAAVSELTKRVEEAS